MYIQFRLPTGSGGMAAQHLYHILEQSIKAWAQQNNVVFKTKIVKWTLRITFDDDRHYSLFALSWKPPAHGERWYEFKFVEPMDIDKSQ